MCLMCGDPLSLEVPLTPFLASEGLMVANGDPSTLTYQVTVITVVNAACFLRAFQR